MSDDDAVEATENDIDAILALMMQDEDETTPREAVRYTVVLAEPFFGVAEIPKGSIVRAATGDAGVVLGTTEDHLQALVQFRGPVMVYVPWLSLEVTGRRTVTLRRGTAS